VPEHPRRTDARSDRRIDQHRVRSGIQATECAGNN
jgi:hypothetical protein